MSYTILLTISLTDVIHTAVIGWFVYKYNKTRNIQHATAFPFQASAPEADISMIDSVHEKAF